MPRGPYAVRRRRLATTSPIGTTDRLAMRPRQCALSPLDGADVRADHRRPSVAARRTPISVSRPTPEPRATEIRYLARAPGPTESPAGVRRPDATRAPTAADRRDSCPRSGLFGTNTPTTGGLNRISSGYNLTIT